MEHTKRAQVYITPEKRTRKTERDQRASASPRKTLKRAPILPNY